MGFRPKENMFEVEVYSLRLNAWRKISAVPPDVVFPNEEFKRIMLPRAVPAVLEQTPIRVSENSLSFFHRRHDEQLGWFYELWILEMYTWKKTHTILLPTRVYVSCSLGFTENGRFLTVVPSTFPEESNLVLYDPQSQQPSNTEIKMMKPCGYVDAY
ncbi:unnamed protein product [Prunus armeniaca]|uniref:F-box associated domain-containing protein n=1 Tax=Prunus armeniaca TaxID=36596 RepID=A0A6J5U692_PRUAR|nr:unnamed protein product [Prunus armeniaca]